MAVPILAEWLDLYHRLTPAMDTLALAVLLSVLLAHPNCGMDGISGRNPGRLPARSITAEQAWRKAAVPREADQLLDTEETSTRPILPVPHTMVQAPTLEKTVIVHHRTIDLGWTPIDILIELEVNHTVEDHGDGMWAFSFRIYFKT